MNAPTGWYPDPAGQPGMFRYWNGSTWSHELSPFPTAPPPASATPTTDIAALAPKSAPVGWIIGGVAVAVVLAIIAFLVFAQGPKPGPAPDAPTAAAEPTASVSPANRCPHDGFPGVPQAKTIPGRVAAGHVSVPRLAPPWEVPRRDPRIPFAVAAWNQHVTTEKSSGLQAWAADIIVAQLLSGDGFMGPEDGSKLILECLQEDMYTPGFHRQDLVSKAFTVDGHPAWYRESKVFVSPKGLKTKYDLALIVVVNTGKDSAGLFFASIPDTNPEHLATARDTLSKMTVDV